MEKNSILIVEDDGILAIHLEDMLSNQGYQVLKPVATGEEAVQFALDQHPSLILMDIELGGKINGIQAAEQISQKDDVPIIFLTGFSQDPLLQEAKITAPYGYLVKPVPERELAATIEMALYRHQLDHKIKESEARFRSLIEQASDGIFLTDEKGNFIEVNSSLCNLLGYDANDLLSLNFVNILSPEFHSIMPLRLQEMADGKTISYEQRLIRKDGKTIHAEISGRKLEDGNLQGIARDITQRKITEEALKRSEEKFSTAFRVSPDSININRLSDGMYLEINSGFTELTGYSWDDVKGKTSIEIAIWVDPADRARLVKGLREKGEVSNLEASFRLKNGSIKVCLMSAKTIEVDGELCILSITRDITVRIQAERELKESEEKFRSIFENSAIGIAITDLHNNFLTGNPAILKMLGYTEEEYCHLNISDISHPDDAAKDLAMMDEEVTGKRNTFTMIKRNRHKDGHTIWGKLTSTIVMDGAGNPKYTIGMFEDISDQKKAEDSLSAQEKLFRTVFDTVPVGIFIVNKEGRITELNPAGQRIWDGVRYSELDELNEYKGWWRSNGKRLGSHDWGSARAAEKGESVMNEEIEIESFNGTHKIITNSAVPLLDDQNQLTGAVAVVQDITERTKAVEAIHRRNEYLGALQETVYELITQLDLDLLLENIALRASQMFSTSAFYIDLMDTSTGYLVTRIGKGVMSATLNHSIPLGEGVSGTVWQTKKPFVVNDYHKRAGIIPGYETKSVFSVAGVPLLAGDEILGVLGLAYDLESGRTFNDEAIDYMSQFARLATIAIKNTRLYNLVQQELAERKAAEAALRESEERFHQMFEGHNATMLLISPETHEIIDANPAACRFYGYSMEEMRGMDIGKINLSSGEMIESSIQHILNESALYLEFPHRLASGEVRTVEVHSSPIIVNNQSILFSIIHDITERKQAEEQVQKQLNELRRWNSVTLGRETRIMELKQEVNDLLKKVGLPQRYNYIEERGNE